MRQVKELRVFEYIKNSSTDFHQTYAIFRQSYVASFEINPSHAGEGGRGANPPSFSWITFFMIKLLKWNFG